MHESSHPPKILEFLTNRGAAPALTWYAGSGLSERIELSGKVCANHLTKIANYLSLECELGVGQTMWVDLPSSWKSMLWSSAALLLGANLEFLAANFDVQSIFADGSPAISQQDLQSTSSFGSSAVFSDGDLILTNRPEFWTAGAGSELAAAVQVEIVALNLDSLAFAWASELPDDAFDGQAEVMGQPDALIVETQMSESNWGNYVLPQILLQRDAAAGYVQANTADATVFLGADFLSADTNANRLAAKGESAVDTFQKIFTAWSKAKAVVILLGNDNLEKVLKSEGF